VNGELDERRYKGRKVDLIGHYVDLRIGKQVSERRDRPFIVLWISGGNHHPRQVSALRDTP
jgi:hypothetical protein